MMKVHFIKPNVLIVIDEVMEQMLQAGTAYRCYCSKERLEKLREEQIAAQRKTAL